MLGPRRATGRASWRQPTPAMRQPPLGQPFHSRAQPLPCPHPRRGSIGYLRRHRPQSPWPSPHPTPSTCPASTCSGSCTWAAGWPTSAWATWRPSPTASRRATGSCRSPPPAPAPWSRSACATCCAPAGALPPSACWLVMVVPILASSAVMDLTTRTVLIDFCDTCAPANRAAYVAYALTYIYVVLAWVGLYLGIKYYGQLQDETRRALAARTMAHQAQLKMLRYQLNPHFLFNTLNAISTLILDRDNATANRMVQGLSAFLRHSLDNDPMQRVTLQQELDALTLYLDIEKIRFAERLRIETDIEPRTAGARCCRACCCSRWSRTRSSTPWPSASRAACCASRRGATATAGAARERRRPGLRPPSKASSCRPARAWACATRASGCACCTARPAASACATASRRRRSHAAPAVRDRADRRRLSMDRRATATMASRAQRPRPLRTLIVDDEPLARRGLEIRLARARRHRDRRPVRRRRRGRRAACASIART